MQSQSSKRGIGEISQPSTAPTASLLHQRKAQPSYDQNGRRNKENVVQLYSKQPIVPSNLPANRAKLIGAKEHNLDCKFKLA